jgi:hypothetical protein
MASDDDFITDDEWDEEVMVEVRKFAADLNAVFKDADRIVNYVLGDVNP